MAAMPPPRKEHEIHSWAARLNLRPRHCGEPLSQQRRSSGCSLSAPGSACGHGHTFGAKGHDRRRRRRRPGGLDRAAGAGTRLTRLELVADTAEFTYKPLAVAEPFGAGVAHHFDLTRIARDQAARCTSRAWRRRSRGAVVQDMGRAPLRLRRAPRGRRRARRHRGAGSVWIKGPAYTNRFRTVLRELDRRKVTKVAFAVPAGTSWPLPLYELALLTARRGGAGTAQGRAQARHTRVPAARALRRTRPPRRCGAARGAWFELLRPRAGGGTR